MINQTIIQGNLSREPELKFSQSGKAICRFTVAYTPRSRNKQTNQFEDGTTLWLDCTLWERKAELAAEHLTKGSTVQVVGTLVQDNWEDKQTGQKRSKIQLNVSEFAVVLKQPRQQQAQSDGWGGYDEAVPF